MGSPLGPVLANLFMSHNEGSWIENYKGVKPFYYRRYVDDIFVLIRRSDHIVKLAEFSLSQQPNIKFLYELENDNTLPFLDVDVFRDAGRFYSIVHI